MELETTRLALRHWTPAHFDGYASGFVDEEHARFIGGRMDRPEAWRHMATVVGHWTLRGYGPWAVEEKATGTFAGCVGLWFPEGWPELEVGYWLLPSMAGKGYATEAAAAARDYARDQLGAHTLVSYIHPDNTASKRVAERLGAVYESTLELMRFGPHCVYRYAL